jgi:guanyl-specific ribonuclease Sa
VRTLLVTLVITLSGCVAQAQDDAAQAAQQASQQAIQASQLATQQALQTMQASQQAAQSSIPMEDTTPPQPGSSFTATPKFSVKQGVFSARSQ